MPRPADRDPDADLATQTQEAEARDPLEATPADALLGEIDEADPVRVALERLGSPDAVYALSPNRFRAKFALGVLLILAGVAANVLAWQWGVWGIDHIKAFVLFGPLIAGVSILRRTVRSRGLRMLIYPTGFLRVQRAELEAFPWDELAAVFVKTDSAALRSEPVPGAGPVVIEAWLAVGAPAIFVNSAEVRLVRLDGAELTASAVLEDYSSLVEKVQRGSFPELWARTLAHLAGGGVVEFDSLSADRAGLALGSRRVEWGAVTAVEVGGKTLTVRHPNGKWTADLNDGPNPHVWLSLLLTARANAGLAGLLPGEPGG